MKTSTRVALAVAAASLISSTTHAAALQLVVKNTDLPGIAGTTWATSNPFSNPSIDNSGNVAFRAALATGGSVTTSNNTTAWYGGPGSLSLFARTGDQAPGLPLGNNITAINPTNMGLSPNGTLYFAGTTAPSNGYIATGSVSGGFTKVARTGDVLPGVGGVAITGNPAPNLTYYFVNNAGQTLVYSQIASTPVSGGLWVGNGSNLQLAYQTGQSYAGLPTGGTPNGITVPMINGSGSLYVSFLMTNAGSINSTNNEVLTTLPFGSSTFTVIAREGDVAPGSGGATYVDVGPVPPNPEFNTFTAGNGNYNNLGHSLFSIGLEGTGVTTGTTGNDAALFYYDGTAVQLLRRKGDATTAVSGASLALNSAVALNARLNNNDNVAWTTSLTAGVGGVTTSNDAVLLSTQLGSSTDTLVAREGSAVPVVPGALFGSFSNLLQNNANQLVFSTTLLDDLSNANDNVTTANDLALFGWDPVGGYSLIAREGDNLSSIGINMTLTGSWLSMFNTANTEGGAYALTDNGWLTFRVSGTALPTFSDNAAIVRTQIPVPEPGTLTMLAAVGALALRRRRAV